MSGGNVALPMVHIPSVLLGDSQTMIVGDANTTESDLQRLAESYPTAIYFMLWGYPWDDIWDSWEQSVGKA